MNFSEKLEKKIMDKKIPIQIKKENYYENLKFN